MEKARDLGPQILRLNYGGELRELKFNNNAMRIAEDVYDECYGKKDCSWVKILQDLSLGKSGAVTAVYFGALKASDPAVTWEEFEDRFHLSDIPAVAEALSGAIKAALPKAEAGQSKNA